MSRHDISSHGGIDFAPQVGLHEDPLAEVAYDVEGNRRLAPLPSELSRQALLD